MKIEIKSWLTGSVLFEGDFSSFADALKEAIKTRANLSGANLSGANLSRADLYGANFSGADLSGANFSGANLYGANLSRADLSGADLSGANFSVANLSGADLYGANLSGANLSRADLSRADLSGANLYGADLSRADLSVANLSGADLYAHAQVSFKGHGKCGRMLTVIRQKEGDEARFFCGCFRGTEAELRQYIADGYKGYVKTRTLALETVLTLLAAQNKEVSK
jgi:uncharacterized protein YjbI with pentapeptide repeats